MEIKTAAVFALLKMSLKLDSLLNLPNTSRRLFSHSRTDSIRSCTCLKLPSPLHDVSAFADVESVSISSNQQIPARAKSIRWIETTSRTDRVLARRPMAPPYNVSNPPLAILRHPASSSPPQTASNTCRISSRRVGHVLCTSARPSLYSTIHAMFTRIEQYCVVPLLSSDKTSKIYRTSNRPHEKTIEAAKTRHQS